MKKNKTLRIAVVIMVAALCATCILSGTTTLARYAATAKGTGSVDVAGWSILVDPGGQNEIDIAIDDDIDFVVDLFDNILCKVESGQEIHTDPAGKLIAPGTYGYLGAIDIKNASQVYADIDVEIEVSTPWMAAGASGITGLTFTPPLDASGVFKKSFANVAPGATVNFTATDFMWEWVIGGNEAEDTAIGIAAAAGGVTFPATVTITATQVD